VFLEQIVIEVNDHVKLSSLSRLGGTALLNGLKWRLVTRVLGHGQLLAQITGPTRK
jgi:hypothetical protein